MNKDLTKLIELQDAATPGPWSAKESQSSSTTRIIAAQNAEVAQIKYLDAYCGYGTINANNAALITAARNFDFAALDEKIKRYEEVLRTIAEYGDEENEWDAVDKYKDVRGVARKAIEQ